MSDKSNPISTSVFHIDLRLCHNKLARFPSDFIAKNGVEDKILF